MRADTMDPENHSWRDVELAKYMYRRSDAFRVVNQWHSMYFRRARESFMENYKAREKPPLWTLELGSTARSELESLLDQFEREYGRLTEDLYSELLAVSYQLTSENINQELIDEIIRKFSEKMNIFADTVKTISIKKLDEGISVLRDFERDHEGDSEYENDLSSLILVHSRFYRKIAGKMNQAVNGHVMDLLGFLENNHLDSEVLKLVRKSMNSAGIESILLS